VLDEIIEGQNDWLTKCPGSNSKHFNGFPTTCPFFLLPIFSVLLSICPSVRQSVCLSVQLSASLYNSICICIFAYLSFYRIIQMRQGICLSIYLSVCQLLCLSLSLSLNLSSPYISVSSSLCLSVTLCLYMSLSLHFSTYSFLFLSTPL